MVWTLWRWVKPIPQYSIAKPSNLAQLDCNRSRFAISLAKNQCAGLSLKSNAWIRFGHCSNPVYYYYFNVITPVAIHSKPATLAIDHISRLEIKRQCIVEENSKNSNISKMKNRYPLLLEQVVEDVVAGEQSGVQHSERPAPNSEHWSIFSEHSCLSHNHYRSTQNPSINRFSDDVLPFFSGLADSESPVNSDPKLQVVPFLVTKDRINENDRTSRPSKFPQLSNGPVSLRAGPRHRTFGVGRRPWQLDTLKEELKVRLNERASVCEGPVTKQIGGINLLPSVGVTSLATPESGGYPGDIEYWAAHDSIDSGNFLKAQTSLQSALEIQQMLLGTDHIRTAATVNSMGIISTKMGQYEQALEFYERALKIMEGNSQVRNVATADIIDNIGRMNVALGKYDVAVMRFEEAKRIKLETVGLNDPSLADSEGNLGEANFEMARFNVATIHYREGLRICERCFGVEHLATAQMMEDLARTYHSLRDYSSSLQLYQKVLAIKLRLADDYAERADTMHNMAVTLQEVGFYDLALKLFDQALLNYKREGSKDARKTANTFKNMSVVYSKQRHHSKAIDSLKQALLIEGRNFGLNDLNTANTFNNLGVIYGNIGNYSEAIRLYEIALNITRRFRPQWHVEIGHIHNNIGMALLAQGIKHHPDAREHFNHSYRSFATAFGVEHVETRKVKELLESVVRRRERDVRVHEKRHTRNRSTVVDEIGMRGSETVRRCKTS